MLSLVLIAPTHGGMARLSGLDKYWDGIPAAKVVTNPGTNRARRSLTLLRCDERCYHHDEPVNTFTYTNILLLSTCNRTKSVYGH